MGRWLAARTADCAGEIGSKDPPEVGRLYVDLRSGTATRQRVLTREKVVWGLTLDGRDDINARSERYEVVEAAARRSHQLADVWAERRRILAPRREGLLAAGGGP
jgi:hypothetical protein